MAVSVSALALAACQTVTVETKPVAKAMAPAAKPQQYVKGTEVPVKTDGVLGKVTVLDVEGDWANLRTASGTEIFVNVDFTMPPKTIKNMNGRNLKLTVKGGDYANFWPLKVGNKAAIDYTWEVNGRAGNNTRHCEVLSQENITVEAGNFDTYKVQCYEGQGQWYERRTWYYAPSIKNWVKLITEGRNASDIELASAK